MPWVVGLTPEEQTQVASAVGPISALTPPRRMAYHHADFRLTPDAIYLGDEEVGPISEVILRKIQNYCFDYLSYAPMVYYNTMFMSEISCTRTFPYTHNLTLEDIVKGRVVGYREKVDGDLVWKCEYSRGERRRPGWCGGMSSPCYLPCIDYFEIKGLKAYSVSPFNVKTAIYFPGAVLEFVPRMVYSSVQPEWEEGAIALVQQAVAIHEKRVKFHPTAEVLVLNNKAVIDGREYPLRDDGEGDFLDGIYEATYHDEKIVIQGYRPWKMPSDHFFREMRAPSVHDLQPVLISQIECAGIRLFKKAGGLVVPATIIMPPVLANPVVLSGALEVLSLLAIGKEARPGPPVRNNPEGREWVAVGSEGQFQSMQHVRGSTMLGLSIPWETLNAETPFGRIAIDYRPRETWTLGCTSGRYRQVFSPTKVEHYEGEKLILSWGYTFNRPRHLDWYYLQARFPHKDLLSTSTVPWGEIVPWEDLTKTRTALLAPCTPFLKKPPPVKKIRYAKTGPHAPRGVRKRTPSPSPSVVTVLQAIIKEEGPMTDV